MEKDASATHQESWATGAQNLYSGDAYTDEVLMKAGAENIEEVDVANVNLVCCSFFALLSMGVSDIVLGCSSW
jgi:Trk K+ transport system NAD-binding subunit